MPDGKQQVACVGGTRDRRKPDGVGPSVAPSEDLELIAAQIDRITALADAGSLPEGREACADFMFNFQPLLVARPELLECFSAVLSRCKAGRLLRRLTTAVHGDVV